MSDDHHYGCVPWSDVDTNRWPPRQWFLCSGSTRYPELLDASEATCMCIDEPIPGSLYTFACSVPLPVPVSRADRGQYYEDMSA